MDMQQAGESHNQLIIQLYVMYFYLSLSTERRWHDLSTNLGHYRQCRRTGNRRALVLCDHDQILLALYRVIYPKAMATEINAFLYRTNYGSLNFWFYSSSQISECEM